MDKREKPEIENQVFDVSPVNPVTKAEDQTPIKQNIFSFEEEMENYFFPIS